MSPFCWITPAPDLEVSLCFSMKTCFFKKTQIITVFFNFCHRNYKQLNSEGDNYVWLTEIIHFQSRKEKRRRKGKFCCKNDTFCGTNCFPAKKEKLNTYTLHQLKRTSQNKKYFDNYNLYNSYGHTMLLG